MKLDHVHVERRMSMETSYHGFFSSVNDLLFITRERPALVIETCVA